MTVSPLSTTASLPPIARAAHARRDALATISNGEKQTFGQLLNSAACVQRRLAERTDVKLEGERIAFLCPPSFDFVAVQWGAWAARAIAVPLCTTHPPAELEYTLRDSGAAVVVYHPSFKDRLEPLREKLATVAWISLDDAMNSPDLDNAAPNAADPVVADDEAEWKDRGALMIYTSGTTGKPKAVLTTHGNIQAQVKSLAEAWKFTPNDRILNVLPLHHVHGLINALNMPLWSGATCEFMPFHAAHVWERFMSKQRDLTVFMAVPTVYAKLLQHYDTMSPDQQSDARDACRQFRLMVSGSAALPDGLFRKWEAVSGHQLLERYGMTEIGMALGNPYNGPRIPGTVGKPFPGVGVSIRDETGADAQADADGTVSGDLFVSGPQVFKEYWNKPEATRKKLSADGWFRTGDLVSRDANGVHRILGRASVDIIKSSGYKISAPEIEREAMSCSIVKDIAVLGLKNEEYGETIAAMVVFAEGEEGENVATLKAFLKDKLAPYKIPRRYLAVKELPRNVMGKVNKKQLVGYFEEQE
ncbi:Acyl-CoA synthetase member 3, mitochondrial [Geranomyces variabilis]|nr:Acyl-CoA synthetase member 3, mitochondrial [Geranomyces variabilis]